MHEFKVGEMIEVSDDGTGWIRREFQGMFNGWFMAKLYTSDRPTAWQKARPVEPQYRTPTIADWGKKCEFWDFNPEVLVTRIIRGTIPELEYQFVANNGARYRNARIKVEE